MTEKVPHPRQQRVDEIIAKEFGDKVTGNILPKLKRIGIKGDVKHVGDVVLIEGEVMDLLREDFAKTRDGDFSSSLERAVGQLVSIEEINTVLLDIPPKHN
jgi:hypothetical protein